jgi:DNA repair protein RadC
MPPPAIRPTASEAPEGPRERLRRRGREGLGDAELLAIVLGTGTASLPVELLAARVLAATGGLRGLGVRGVGELAALAGIGPGKASRLVAAVELGRRAVARPWPRGPRLVSSRRVHEVLAPRLVELAEERFLALALDAKHRCVAELEVARGGLTSCPVAPADVFRRLLKEAAAATVLVHNHPSGDPARASRTWPSPPAWWRRASSSACRCSTTSWWVERATSASSTWGSCPGRRIALDEGGCACSISRPFF